MVNRLRAMKVLMLMTGIVLSPALSYAQNSESTLANDCFVNEKIKNKFADYNKVSIFDYCETASITQKEAVDLAINYIKQCGLRIQNTIPIDRNPLLKYGKKTYDNRAPKDTIYLYNDTDFVKIRTFLNDNIYSSADWAGNTTFIIVAATNREFIDVTCRGDIFLTRDDIYDTFYELK
jgi:hypothetical protein